MAELHGYRGAINECMRDRALGGGIGGIICSKGRSVYYYFGYNHDGDVISAKDQHRDEVPYYEWDAWRIR